MPKTYIVERGECISSIAHRHGFFPRTIWEHPENSALREVRTSPNVLVAGDRVHIPDLDPHEAQGATDQRHRFVLRGVPAKLHVVLRDDGEPIASAPFTAIIDGVIHTGTTTGEGRIELGDRCASHRKARALLGSLGSEGQEHDTTATSDMTPRLLDVPRAFVVVDEEVEHGAVVPHPEGPFQRDVEHVAHDPPDLIAALADAFARRRECRRGDVEHDGAQDVAAGDALGYRAYPIDGTGGGIRGRRDERGLDRHPREIARSDRRERRTTVDARAD